MENASDRLSRVVEQLVRRLRASAAAEPLSQAAASALSRLDEDGPLGVTRLARSEGVSQPAMTQLVDRLAAEGLVERRTPDEDRRSVLVRLTPAGLEALTGRRVRRAARLDERVRSLSGEDRAAIAAALPALERLAEAVRPDQQRAGQQQTTGTTDTTEKEEESTR